MGIGFGAAAFGKRFRLYSIVTILLLILGGALAGIDGARMAEHLPTPMGAGDGRYSVAKRKWQEGNVRWTLQKQYALSFV